MPSSRTNTVNQWWQNLKLWLPLVEGYFLVRVTRESSYMMKMFSIFIKVVVTGVETCKHPSSCIPTVLCFSVYVILNNIKKKKKQPLRVCCWGWEQRAISKLIDGSTSRRAQLPWKGKVQINLKIGLVGSWQKRNSPTNHLSSLSRRLKVYSLGRSKQKTWEFTYWNGSHHLQTSFPTQPWECWQPVLHLPCCHHHQYHQAREQRIPSRETHQHKRKNKNKQKTTNTNRSLLYSRVPDPCLINLQWSSYSARSDHVHRASSDHFSASFLNVTRQPGITKHLKKSSNMIND